jgi:hypothetical protein
MALLIKALPEEIRLALLDTILLLAVVELHL